MTDSSPLNKVSALLSRSELYAPLNAYKQTKVDPSIYLQQKSNVPPSIREGSLFAFLEQISYNYHRHKYSMDAKNAAAKKISSQEYQDRLQQRGLTLVRGGINTSLPPSKPHRRRVVRRKRQKKSRVSGEFALNITDYRNQRAFLNQLNEKWNSYAMDVIKISKTDSNLTPEMIQRVCTTFPSIQLTGARVRLEKCADHPSIVGRQGIIISSTPCDWQIVMVENKTNALDEGSKPIINIMKVNKRGALLTILVSLGNEPALTTCHDNTTQKKSLCILVNGDSK